MDNGFPSIQWWNEIGCGQEAGRGKDGAGSLVPWVDPPRLLDDVVEERQHPAVRQYAFHVVWSHVRQAHLVSMAVRKSSQVARWWSSLVAG